MKKFVIFIEVILPFLFLCSCTSAIFDDSNLICENRYFFRKEMSGDIMLLQVKKNKGRIELQCPVILLEPYFETILMPFDQIDYKEIIKSRVRPNRENGFFEQDLGYMIFSTNNIVVFIPANSEVTQWPNVRGYAAYMENSDIAVWLEKEKKQGNSVISHCPPQALVWFFPLLKSKYKKLDVYWESEETKEFCMLFFGQMESSYSEMISWKLFSQFGELYGW